jgi:hypothetical protein
LKEEERVKRQAVRAWQEKITEREQARDHLTLQIEQVKERCGENDTRSTAAALDNGRRRSKRRLPS